MIDNQAEPLSDKNLLSQVKSDEKFLSVCVSACVRAYIDCHSNAVQLVSVFAFFMLKLVSLPGYFQNICKQTIFFAHGR